MNFSLHTHVWRPITWILALSWIGLLHGCNAESPLVCGHGYYRCGDNDVCCPKQKPYYCPADDGYCYEDWRQAAQACVDAGEYEKCSEFAY